MTTNRAQSASTEAEELRARVDELEKQVADLRDPAHFRAAYQAMAATDKAATAKMMAEDGERAREEMAAYQNAPREGWGKV